MHAPRLRAYFNEVNHQLYGQTTASFLAQRIWDGESDLISVTFLNDKTGAPWEFSRSATTPAYFNAIVDGSECEVLVLMPPGYLIILLPPYAIREKNYFTVSGSVTLMSGVQQ